MKLLGIDYGTKRIGLATSSGIYSAPFDVIKNKGETETLTRLLEIIAKEKVDAIVLGVPLNPRGGDTKMSILIREFGEKLQLASNLPLHFHNEILSSWEAEEYIKNTMGIKDPKKIAAIVDKVAASMLLQEYINTVGEDGNPPAKRGV